MPGQGIGLGVKGLAGFGNPAALGHRVRRFGQALALDWGTAAFDIFEVNGGDVLITHIYGIVTTQMLGGAPVPQLQHNPDGALGNTPMCDVAVDIVNDDVNTIYTWDGTIAGALAVAGAASLGVGEAGFTTNYQVLVPGVINVTQGAGVATQGVVDWILHYVPLDTDSVVVPLYA